MASPVLTSQAVRLLSPFSSPPCAPFQLFFNSTMCIDEPHRAALIHWLSSSFRSCTRCCKAVISTHRLSFLTPRHLMLPCRAVRHARTATQPRACHCIRRTAAFLRAAPCSNYFPVKVSGLSMRVCRQSKTASRKQLFAHLLHGLHIPQHAAAGCISCAHTHSSALPSHTHWPSLCLSVPTHHPKE
jgi:hypothetical protein